MHTILRILSLIVVPALAAGCASSAAGVPLAPTAPAALSAPPAASPDLPSRLLLRLTIPAQSHRARFVSPSTRSLVVLLAGATTVRATVDTTAANAKCKGTPLFCAIPVVASPGTYAMALAAYDRAPVNGAIPAGAKQLATLKSVPITILSGKTTSYAVSLDGVPAKIVVDGFPGASAGTPLTAQPFAVTAYDADGNAIMGTYASPIVLHDGDTTGITNVATTGPDSPPAKTLLSSSDTPQISYTGGELERATITASAREAHGSGNFNIHQLIYVVDQVDGIVDVMLDNCKSASCVTPIGGGFGHPGGVAVDPSQVAYVTDADVGTVQIVPKGCASAGCVTSIGGGLDTNGNLAVAPDHSAIVPVFATSSVDKIPSACTSAACMTTVGGGFSQPVGAASDGAGNFYVADMKSTSVLKIPAGCTSASCVTPIGGGFNEPYATAVDPSGNVYVADYMNSAIKQIPPGCTSSSCVVTLGGGFIYPMGIAVDQLGNVIVGDTGTGRVKWIPKGCQTATCVVQLGGGFGTVLGVAVY